MAEGLARRIRKVLYVLRSPRLWRPVLLSGAVPAIEHLPVLRGFQFDTVLDIGANRGQFTILARQLWPSSEILSFEPLSEPADRLARSIRATDRTQLFRFALGDVPDTSAMQISRRDDSSSLLRIGEQQLDVFPGTGVKGEANVEVRRLDSLVGTSSLGRRTLVKLDVQGYELNVLRGMGELLASCDVFLIELSFVELYEGQALAHEVIGWLHERGFSLVALGVPITRDGQVVQADGLFTARPSSRGG
jgi:FkbM family methyltransferase